MPLDPSLPFWVISLSVSNNIMHAQIFQTTAWFMEGYDHEDLNMHWSSALACVPRNRPFAAWEVQHIPGGCTGLVQPVDVGINKPFKNRCRDRWESWMIADGLLTNTTKPPTRALIAQWCDESLKEVTPQIVRNAWRHGTYSYFPLTAQTREEAERQAALDASIANTTA